MPVLENQKHEAFAQARALGKTCDEAYALAGYNPHRSNAARLSTNERVLARQKELQQVTAEKHEITVELIAAELEEERRLALEWKQPSAAVAATVAKGKLGGLFVEKTTVNVTHNYNMMTVEELRFEIAAITAEARISEARRAELNERQPGDIVLIVRARSVFLSAPDHEADELVPEDFLVAIGIARAFGDPDFRATMKMLAKDTIDDNGLEGLINAGGPVH